MQRVLVFLAGLLFGAGVTVGGMVNPVKVQNFMDIAGNWDPTLALVMAAALAVTAVGYRYVFSRGAPLFAEKFSLPTRTDIDGKLVGGAAIFGLGWGLSGFCPGPAVATLLFGNWLSYAFVIAMAVGVVLARLFMQYQARIAEPARLKG
jgi:uncharacterized membrane protein YedE/YeeE